MRPHPVRRLGAAATAAVLAGTLAGSLAGATGQAHAAGGKSDVFPSLRRDLVAHYDFDHPAADPAIERDLGSSGTDIRLINGGAAMRVRDRAHRGSRLAVQLGQVNPAATGNDDWKAGIYSATGVPSLRAFNAARETTIMGWFKMTGTNPSPNTVTPDPADLYNAVGLAGILTGNSEGHAVRALLEIINVGTELRVVALARRIDTGASQTFAADTAWQDVLPLGEWVFLAATYDFDNGVMALYKNGRPLTGFYTVAGDPWAIAGDPEPDLTTATDPAGIKIGGSFPQNTVERNPCNCRMDSLLFLDRALSPREIWHQYQFTRNH